MDGMGAVLVAASFLAAGASGAAEGNTMNTDWQAHAEGLRQNLATLLTLPEERCPLDPRSHRSASGDGYTVESITYASEPGSRVTALLYLPAPCPEKAPAVLLCCGHGGSKSGLAYQYAGQLYAKMGFACLVPDTIGEEERNKDGGMGTRAHDMYQFKTRAERRSFTREKIRRMVLGKVVWDLIRGLDYLESRPEVDAQRMGVVGNSMGGTTAGFVAVLDQRVHAAAICGWSMTTQGVIEGKDCSRMPYEAVARIMSFNELHALLAPHAPTLFINGTRDSIIDTAEGGAGVVRRIRACIAGAQQILDDAGMEGVIEAHFVPNVCHQAHPLTRPAVEWVQRYLMTESERRPIPEGVTRYGDWVAAQGQRLEKLYDTEERQAGTPCVPIDAVWRQPRELACFPDTEHPTREYTWEGWVEQCVSADGPPLAIPEP